jgi:hypothetical protein
MPNCLQYVFTGISLYKQLKYSIPMASPANPYSQYWLALPISMPGHSPVFSTSTQLYAIFFQLLIGSQVADDLFLHNLNLFSVKGLT